MTESSTINDIITRVNDSAIKEILLFASDNIKARVAAEQIMRDDARRRNEDRIADMHADRALAFSEAANAILRLSE